MKRPSRSRKSPARKRTAPARRTAAVSRAATAAQIEQIRKQIEQVGSLRAPRWNADPDDVRRSVMKLVLTLVELIRQILERQAIRRMEHKTLTAEETENVGLALMRLQETVLDLAAQFDIDPSELNLDLGPLGKVL